MTWEQVQADIKKIRDQIQEISAKYGAYEQDVQAEIKTLLVGAGVFDAVHAVEKEKAEVRAEAQEKVQKLERRMGELQIVERYLKDSATSNPPPAVPEPSAEDVDTPVLPEIPDEEPPKPEPPKLKRPQF